LSARKFAIATGLLTALASSSTAAALPFVGWALAHELPNESETEGVGVEVDAVLECLGSTASMQMQDATLLGKRIDRLDGADFGVDHGGAVAVVAVDDSPSHQAVARLISESGSLAFLLDESAPTPAPVSTATAARH
jgi:hypothetical protein